MNNKPPSQTICLYQFLLCFCVLCYFNTSKQFAILFYTIKEKPTLCFSNIVLLNTQKFSFEFELFLSISLSFNVMQKICQVLYFLRRQLDVMRYVYIFELYLNLNLLKSKLIFFFFLIFRFFLFKHNSLCYFHENTCT